MKTEKEKEEEEGEEEKKDIMRACREAGSRMDQ